MNTYEPHSKTENSTEIEKSLSDLEKARSYLDIAIKEYEKDSDLEAFLLALRKVAEAQGGLGELARRTGLNREHLYRALSEDGNPQLSTVDKILHGLGFRFSVKLIDSGQNH
jgi:probable addiction module antidote protein